MKAVAFSSKCSNTFEPKVPRDVHVSSLLLSAESHSTATGGCHPAETGYSADTKQKVSKKEAPSVKHMKGELTWVQAKYWNVAVNLKTLFQRNKAPL